MIAPFVWAVLLFLVEGFIATEYSRASHDPPCINYVLSFDKAPIRHDDLVYLDDFIIGNVAMTSQEGKRTYIHVCISQPYAKRIEQGTLSYMSKGKINIYNVWASGGKLAQDTEIKGFSNKIDLYAYEMKSLGQMVLRFLGLGKS